MDFVEFVGSGSWTAPTGMTVSFFEGILGGGASYADGACALLPGFVTTNEPSRGTIASEKASVGWTRRPRLLERVQNQDDRLFGGPTAIQGLRFAAVPQRCRQHDPFQCLHRRGRQRKRCGDAIFDRIARLPAIGRNAILSHLTESYPRDASSQLGSASNSRRVEEALR